MGEFFEGSQRRRLKNMLKFCLILGLSAWLVAGNPAPIEVDEPDYEDEDVCLTSADSADPEKECIFPFTFNNFTYHGCPTDPVNAKNRWCSTKTDENGVHVDGNNTWGFCTLGCRPEIFLDELLLGTDADNDTQTETCDYTACNGFTYKLDVFDKVQTYGQCQFPAGKDGATDDYFCFVNKDSACKDKVPYGPEEEGLYLSTLACKDPNSPLPRSYALASPLPRRHVSFPQDTGSIANFVLSNNNRGYSYGLYGRYNHRG